MTCGARSGRRRPLLVLNTRSWSRTRRRRQRRRIGTAASRPWSALWPAHPFGGAQDAERPGRSQERSTVTPCFGARVGGGSSPRPSRLAAALLSSRRGVGSVWSVARFPLARARRAPGPPQGAGRPAVQSECRWAMPSSFRGVVPGRAGSGELTAARSVVHALQSRAAPRLRLGGVGLLGVAHRLDHRPFPATALGAQCIRRRGAAQAVPG